MFRRWMILSAVLLAAVAPLGMAGGGNERPPSAERGKQALETQAFAMAGLSLEAYDEVWRQWGVKEKPANYDQAFMERYGLHPAPYPSDYPMGLRKGQGFVGPGLAADCMICHGGSILGKSYVGLGNSTLDSHSYFEEMQKASGMSGKLPFAFSNVRGTSEAGMFAVFLMARRNPDLSLRLLPKEFELYDHLCEDVPAWWLLKKKTTMYHTGITPAKSVRSIMQFMLSSTWGADKFDREEATFRDIQAYILSLEAPKYPFAINADLAKQGQVIFNDTCARCHGTYGQDWTYPNKVVPIDVIGTDPERMKGIGKEWGDYYNQSWFAQEKNGWFEDGYKVTVPIGYQAPPLDGVWATAPYFHNGSVPTLHDVLNSKARPTIFTRSFRTDEAAYDKDKVGWKVQVLERGPDPNLPGIEQRKVYDTQLIGRGNGGHTFGDRLSETERRAVIEYLKTL